MTGTILTTSYPTGYTVADGVTLLDITSVVTIGGNGVIANWELTVGNEGSLSAQYNAAIHLVDGGTVVNGTSGRISGKTGIQSDATASTVTNYGRIAAVSAGVDFTTGTGRVVNGTTLDTSALISGYDGVTIVGGLIQNYGTITGGKFGALAGAGGVIENGTQFDTVALLEGGYGASIGGPGTVTNFGRILSGGSAGVDILGAGQVTNGTSFDRVARITGGTGVEVGGVATLTNFGTVTGYWQYGTELAAGSVLTNGSNGAPGALIDGPEGVSAEGATSIANFGTVLGSAGTGVALAGGGSLVNGSVTDTAALVEGYSAVTAAGTVATVGNFGTILGSAGGPAVTFAAGGTLANGSNADLAAVIAGVTGIDISGAGAVANYGMIDGKSGYGVVLRGGGFVTNGSGSDPGARIDGAIGVDLKAGGSIANFGTIHGNGSENQDAVYLQSAGTVTNGAPGDTTALIDGYDGIQLQGTAVSQNFGTIRGDGVANGVGAVLGGAASLANGSTLDRAALVEGVVGVALFGAATIENFGTIAGTGGTAMLLLSTDDLLVDEAGSVFEGSVIGGGTLELAGGSGTLAGIGTQFDGFGQVTVEVGGRWTLAGSNTLASGDTLADDGVLTLEGSLVNAGRVLGELGLAGGSLTNQAGRTISSAGAALVGTAGLDDTVSNLGTVTASGAAGVGIDLLGGGRIVDGSAGVTTALIAGATGVVMAGPGTVFDFGTISGSGGTALRFGSSQDVLEDEAHAVFAGKVLGGGGTLELAAGSGTLAGLGTTFSGFGLVEADAGAAWTLSGASSLTAGTTLADHGTLTLAGTLTTSGTIADAGSLVVNLAAGGSLVEKAGAVLDLESNTGIATSGTGSAASLANAGLIAKTGGAGVSAIAVALANTGTVEAASGTLDLVQAVSGTGTLELAGSSIMEAGGVVSVGQRVRFTDAGEALLLTDPAGFAAAITGFGAGDKLDLRSFTPVTGEKATFTANAGDTGGTLKVADGANAFSVALFGQYVAAGFHIAADGHGGSAVTYVPPPAPTPVQLAAGH